MPSFRTFVAALMLASGGVGACAHGQSAGEPESIPAVVQAAERESSGPAAQKGAPADGPDIYLLPDENGRLRRVLGYRYEDFFKAWQAEGAAQDDARQPKFAMTSLAVEAIAGEDAVDARITIDVQLESVGWTEVPLQLATLIVDDSKLTGDSSRDFVLFDAKRGGYAAWFKGKPGDRRTIVLEGQLPVERDGDGRRLDVDLPAARSSVINLSTPDAAKVEAPSGALVTTETVDGRIRSRIEGAKTRLAVSWGEAAGEQEGGSTELEGAVESIVTVEQARLTYEAFVSIRSFARPVERVLIKLPPGATASAMPAATGYSVSPVVDEKESDSASIVEVRFDEPAQKPPQIRLVAEQSAAARAAVLRAGTFEVLGAFRQHGHVAVRVNDQLHAHFERDGRARQIAPSDLPDALLAEPPLAAFETSGTGWAVEVHTQARQRKVSVTPQYELHLGSQGAALDVALDYQISGGRIFELRVDLRGWELTEQPIESGGAVELGEQHVTPEQILIMPLKESAVQQVRLRFSLRREAGLGVHDLPLPEVEDAFALPGDLTVTCDDSWRAAAQIEKSVGVSTVEPTTATSEANGDSRGGGPRTASPLRLQTYLPQSRLTVDVSERDRVIAVKSGVDARVDGAALDVLQRLEYEILYQPASELALTVSADLLANEGLELLLDGKAMPSTAVDIQPLPSTTSDEADDELRLIVALPQPMVGRTRMSIRSHLALDAAQLAGSTAIALPLAVPDQAATSSATIGSSDRDQRVVLATAGVTSPWILTAEAEIADDIGAADPHSLRVDAPKPARELAFRLEPANVAPPVETRIAAAWAQTWVAGGMRQDRLVYRFHTNGSRIAVALPPGFEELEVLLDRQLVAVARSRQATIMVEIPPGQGDRTHILELRRHTPLRLGAWGKQSVVFPQIEGANAWSPFFWQLILPSDLGALATPPGMSAEYRLGWQGMRWGREPTQSQRDLERWTGATNAPTPGPRTNQYLFSAFQPPGGVEFVAVRRIWLVVAAGLAALAVGLAWLYTSLARSAAFWLALCIVTAGMLFMYPEVAVVIVQAIVVGGILTLASVVTQWLLAGARPRRSTPPTPASSIASLAATQPWVSELPSGAGASAPSGPSYQASGSAP